MKQQLCGYVGITAPVLYKLNRLSGPRLALAAVLIMPPKVKQVKFGLQYYNYRNHSPMQIVSNKT